MRKNSIILNMNRIVFFNHCVADFRIPRHVKRFRGLLTNRHLFKDGEKQYPVVRTVPPGGIQSDPDRLSGRTDEGPPRRPFRNPRFYTMKSACFTAVVCCVVCAVWYYERKKVVESRKCSTDVTAVGKPDIGGPWTLVNSEGRFVSTEDFPGKYLLLYFGFTLCPDVCPQELEKQALVVEKLDKELGPLVQPIFITVDPARDTVAQIGAYCKDFHPRLQGFTGTPDQIKKVTRSFRVYFNQGVGNEGQEDYLVDHSIIHYLMGPNGNFKDFFGKNMTPSEMSNKIIGIVQADKKRETQNRLKRNAAPVDI